MKDFNFKDIFLELTNTTIPFGYENKLYNILSKYVPILMTDSYGNYYTRIGKSETLFTSHLDTYSKKYEKVNHVIEGDIIKTDGTTVLGGDNKNGVLILLYMIKMKIPGLYYFFKGEEGIVTGKSCNGSSEALKIRGDYFKNFKRAIAFDRRGQGSIVNKQRGRMCCSDEFTNALITEFSKSDLEFNSDYAYGTDSAVFLNTIPEITNISSSGTYEHTFMETTDISYVEKVAKAACKIKWDELPSVRVPKTPEEEFIPNYTEGDNNQEYIDILDRVCSVLSYKGYNCVNYDSYVKNKKIIFSQFVGDKHCIVTIMHEGRIFMKNGNITHYFKDISGMISHFNIKTHNYLKGIIGDIIKKMDSDYTISKDDLSIILNNYPLCSKYNMDINIFMQNISLSEYSEYFNFNYSSDRVYVDIKAGQHTSIKRQKEQLEKVKNK